MGEGQCDLARPESDWTGDKQDDTAFCDDQSDHPTMCGGQGDAAMSGELNGAAQCGEGLLVLNGEYYELVEWAYRDAHAKGDTLVLMGKVFKVSYSDQAAKKIANKLEGKNNRIILNEKSYIVIVMTVDH